MGDTETVKQGNHPRKRYLRSPHTAGKFLDARINAMARLATAAVDWGEAWAHTGDGQKWVITQRPPMIAEGKMEIWWRKRGELPKSIKSEDKA